MPEPLPHEPLNLPAAIPGGEVEADVIDGEIVGEPEPQRPVYVLRVVQVVQVINVVVKAPPARLAARHGSLVAVGAVVALRRWRRHRTRHARMAAAAEAAGDHETALKWTQQAEAERHRRHERRVAVAETVVLLAKASPWILGGSLALMALAGLLEGISMDSLYGFAVPWIDAARAYSAVASVAPDAMAAAAIAAPVAGAVALHEFGRHAGDLAPGWSVTAKQAADDRGLVVTADGIVAALQHVAGIPALTRAFKDGWRPAFHTTPVRDGEGYAAVFSVPMGVTANDIADHVAVFARNLHRAKAEVWVTDAERAKIAPAGFVNLWVANPGVLDRPAPEYPLMHEGTADVFEGVPGGVTARGDGTLIPVAGKNVVVGGQMGEGKSNTCRCYLLGCCTDPLCEVNAFVFANNGDFDAFAPRLNNYFKGTEDDTVSAAVAHLQELYEDVGRREGRLAELGAKKLTRRIAEQHPDMRPVVSLFSECHELFGHPEYGDLAGELAVKIAKRARKTGIVMVFDTQSSRKGAIPPALVELMSVNACFYVKRWQSNDGFLGDGSFQAGIRATELRPGRDRGRSVITGISDAQFELLKWYFIEVDDDTGYDAATEVIARCMGTLAPGTRVMGGDGASLPVITVRDLLGDLDEAVGGPERVKLRDAVGLLRKVDGLYPPYRKLTAARLREDLAAEGVKVVNASGTLYLDPEALHRVVRERGE